MTFGAVAAGVGLVAGVPQRVVEPIRGPVACGVHQVLGTTSRLAHDPSVVVDHHPFSEGAGALKK